jgi:hypothetical protein
MLENQNPDSAKSAEKTEREKELETKLAQAESARIQAEADKNNAVSELKELRAKKQVGEENPDAVKLTVEQILATKRKEEAVENQRKALETFIQTNKEFHPDNDTGGVKLDLLKKELSNFRTDNLYSVEDFVGLMTRASRLLTPAQNPSIKVTPEVAPIGGPGNPNSDGSGKLSTKEKQVIEQLGWTEERYFKLKESMPGYVESLLKQAP